MRAAPEAREVLLIGGDGFIGRPIAHALIRAGRRVTILSRGNHPDLAGAERLIADRGDARSLAAALGGRRFDLTVDLAAYRALDIETLWKVPGAALGRTVMISSGQVYLVTEGRSRAHREGDSRRPPMREPPLESPDHPQWVYGVGKRAAEAAMLALRRHHGVRAMILRLPVVQGEGDPTLRLWAWIERLRDGGPVPLPGGGRRPTRFVDVADVAALVERIAGGLWSGKAIFNLAAARGASLRAFLERTAAAAGAEARLVPVATAKLVAHGLDPRAWPFAGRWSSVVDPSRARRELGFRGTGADEYLPRVVAWHLRNPPAQSHFGYAQRDREREVLAALARTCETGLTVPKGRR